MALLKGIGVGGLELVSWWSCVCGVVLLQFGERMGLRELVEVGGP